MKALYFPGATRGTAGALSTLAAGQWGLMAAGSSMLATDNFVTTLANFTSATAPETLTPKLGFHIVTRAADSSLVISPEIVVDNIVKVTKVAYSAGTSQVITITPSLPATQYAGDIYTLKLIDITVGTANLLRKSFQVVHTGTDFTATTICDAFRTLIAADSDFSFITGSGTTTLILTAAKDRAFATATDDLASVFTTALTTRMIPSSGTLAKVQALQDEIESYELGYWNKVYFPKAGVDRIPASVTTFDITIVEMMLPFNPADGSKVKGGYPFKLYIVETASATNPPSALLVALY